MIKNKLKIFGWYEFIISLAVFVLSINLYINKPLSILFIPYNFFVAIVGLAGGIFLIKGKYGIGFYLSLIWTILQIFVINTGYNIINLTQMIYLTIPITITDIAPHPDIVISINLVGIILLILLILWRKER